MVYNYECQRTNYENSTAIVTLCYINNLTNLLLGSIDPLQ